MPVIDLKSNLNSRTSESLNLAKAILEPSLEQNNYECDNGDDDGDGVGESEDIHSGAWVNLLSLGWMRQTNSNDINFQCG